MQLKPGTLLQSGKYRIEKVLGQGGFGITYLAEQPGLRRKVAIKEFFMKEYCNRDGDTSQVSVPSVGSKELVEKFREKFVKEAQNIASFSHNNIIKIYDVFEENNTAYYVMEYLDCGSLSDYLSDRGRLSEKESLTFIRQIADALSYIHEHRVNHLDIKPGNILLDKKQNAILIDFGLSKHYDEQGGQTSSTPVGISHGYAPLEQYKQGGVSTFSPSTDIYSLGATLYKLLTGTTPPEADDVNENGLSFPSNVHISESIKKAIVYAMQPKRKDRPQSIEEFLKTLDVKKVTEDEDTDISRKVKPNPTPRPKNWFLYVVVALVLGIGVYIVSDIINKNNAEKERIAAEEREKKEREVLAMLDAQKEAMYSAKREYLKLIEDGDKLLSDNKYSESINRYELALSYEEQYMGTEYSKEFDKRASDKIEAANEAERAYKAEQARLEKERKEHEAAEKARLEKEKREREAAEKARLEKERKEREGIYEVNGVTFKMIAVEGGTFKMGATSEQGSDTRSDERPVHSVTLSDYYIGETEVTQELWDAVMGSNPSRFKGSQKPVEDVSWYDCQTFIKKLNRLTGKNFRLPTEAEWEYAARGGNKSKGCKYSGSNTIGNVAWYEDNSGGETHDVKTKQANELGIYDMSGNVWEWCQDYDGDYSSSSQTNPTGPTSGSHRVYRGCSWYDSAKGCRVSYRNNSVPGSTGSILGLRLSLSQD